MSLLDLVPTQYRLAAIAGAGALLLALGAGVTWWGLAPRIDLQAQRADTAEQGRADAQAMVELQAGVLAEQQRTLGRLADVDRAIQQLGQQITSNKSAQDRAFQELKRNDQTVAEYLRGAVPAALGRLYARPETTDPGAYRATDAVQPGAVPAAGAAGADNE